MSDPFTLLGLPRRPRLDERQIRGAFQERARHAHPDAPGGNADDFAALNAAQKELTDPASRLRVLAGDTPLPAMPSNFQLGFRVADTSRKAGTMIEKLSAATNVLAKTLLLREAAPLRAELTGLGEELKVFRGMLDAELLALDERWPEVPPAELARVAAEYAFLGRWEAQLKEAEIGLRLATLPAGGGSSTMSS